MLTDTELAARHQVCKELQCIQKDRVQAKKTRIMVHNRIVAVVAVNRGYKAQWSLNELIKQGKKSCQADCDERSVAEDKAVEKGKQVLASDRKKRFSEARKIVQFFLDREEHRLNNEDRLRNDKEAKPWKPSRAKGALTAPPSDLTDSCRLLIDISVQAIAQFMKHEAELDNESKALMQSPAMADIFAWIKEPEQEGAGEVIVSQVIGETGDLSLYSGPAKVWRRMGCAPYTFDNETHMCSWWARKKGDKLPPWAWKDAGNSPRRRAVSYMLAWGLRNNNHVKEGKIHVLDSKGEKIPGPYRVRYLEAKATMMGRTSPAGDLEIESFEDDTEADQEGGGTKTITKGSMHAELHGNLLAAKLFLKNLWRRWNGNPPVPDWK